MGEAIPQRGTRGEDTDDPIKHRPPAREIVVDVTSGTSLSTTAAVAVALSEGWRIQYVEGDPGGDYRVLQAEIGYRELE